MSYLTIIGIKNEVLFSGIGDFNFYEDSTAIVNNDVVLFVHEHEPIFNTEEKFVNGKSAIKYFPEDQPKN